MNIPIIIFLSAFSFIIDGCRSYNPAGNFIITDITEETGFGGPSHPDSLGGHGVMWSDVTKNGFPDVYVTMNWKSPDIEYPELFYTNDGRYNFPELAKQFGIDDVDGGSHGAVFADLNNNGYFDLINGSTLTVEGEPASNRIYENREGEYFTDRTPVSIRNTFENTRGVAAFDFNRNGLLDIVFMTGWRGAADPHERNEIYINQGDFNFIKYDLEILENAVVAQGVIATDFDGDGNIDILGCNMGGDMLILKNDGNNGMYIVDPAEYGIKHRAYSGITTGDLNNNGLLDLILVYNTGGGRPHEAFLYMNNGDKTFTHTHTFENVDGYMAGLADIDLDTYLDIVFDGHPYVYLNNGDGTFRKGPEIPLDNLDDPRCVAFADINNNGNLDFAFAVKRDINRLYRNDYNGPNRWLKINLYAPNGQAGAYGAKIYIYDTGENLIGMREAKSSYGYLAQDDPVIHFGTGRHRRVNLRVEFITGEVTELTNVRTKRTITIR